MIEFLHWQSKWWLDKQALISADDPMFQEGLKAYAKRQATLREDLENISTVFGMIHKGTIY